ncbi:MULTISPECIES: hypothetical protein [Leptolyngbya]|uniref:hypothetical protein n=1 Tax=Leptolyngbya TaxID=47251 RepID=UPI0016849523|nr:hypothetical protein [Leptolyngbya sp. FACHB-1624]MBD1857080.1 hypothetical protein [Leptolyngbya sp. FACHB-1624]
MIISFNPSVFNSQDEDLQNLLAEILRILMKPNNHFLDFKSIKSVFYNKNNEYTFEGHPICKKYFSAIERANFKEFLSKISRINITLLHKQHLTTIVVGIDKSKEEVHPRSLHNIITERSMIIVENGINDWKFIQGIVQKYSSGRTKRQTIYQLIDKAIKSEALESEHCGGIGDMEKIANSHIESKKYNEVFRYKLMAIFDSDKENPGDLPKHKKRIEYFKGRQINCENDYAYEHDDLIIWHVLHKRKIENYVPLNVLFSEIKSITPIQKNALLSKTAEELDFIEYDQSNIGKGKASIKEKFPQMFLASFPHHELEKRCEHHKFFTDEAGECISEIEQILLKIAKIL